MNTEKLITELQSQIEVRQTQINWLKSNQEKLSVIPFDGSFYCGQLDFDRLEHREVIEVIKAIGGTWAKEPCSSEPRINYIGKLEGVSIRCYAGEPPPSCKIVEFEIEVPAHKTVQRKLVCADQPQPAEALSANSGGE